ncbi:hypothetical protein [Fluviicola sp.]|jgi:hypothetical protein|uniref:hypothetical protein n=1 Tax=Fluviicola sp. TaxID=1917219 RepID=UPI0028278125|nr:hypothetical protein [Fluviicola sp.]MDR0803252.1 hypothetical protein [Fluviicola sp.]
MKERFEVFLETDTIDFSYRLKLTENNISIHKNGTFLCMYDEVKSVWAHRSEIMLKSKYSELEKDELLYVKRHQDTQVKAIQHLLHKKKCLGRFGNLNFNKLVFLDVCRELNIDIPETLITQKKEDLRIFFNTQKNGIIVKSLARNFHHCVSITEHSQIWQHGITNTINESQFDQIPQEFDLSLFQEKLEKKYELRILYVDGICFSQVIFSQKYAFSEVDYRQGLGGSEMRQCNYHLPSKLTNQIKMLMNELSISDALMLSSQSKIDMYFWKLTPPEFLRI